MMDMDALSEHDTSMAVVQLNHEKGNMHGGMIGMDFNINVNGDGDSDGDGDGDGDIDNMLALKNDIDIEMMDMEKRYRSPKNKQPPALYSESWSDGDFDHEDALIDVDLSCRGAAVDNEKESLHAMDSGSSSIMSSQKRTGTHQQVNMNDTLKEKLATLKKRVQLSKVKLQQQDIVKENSLFNRNSIEKVDSKQKLIRRPFGDSDFMPVTTKNGNRGYLVLKPVLDEEGEALEAAGVASKKKQLCLLPVSVAQMREIVQDDEVRAAVRRTDEAQKKAAAEANASGAMWAPASKRIENIETLLWVDKYRPRVFSDLLSDDRVNREVLLWVKMWDRVVFKRREPDIEKRRVQRAQDHQNFLAKQAEEHRRPFTPYKIFPNEAFVLGKDNRPLRKFILLCGPPGLGKTTLAHIIARHAGYDVTEMNASDDRTPEVFRERIIAATKMNGVSALLSGAPSRPNCLVIDEIDGASMESIKVLLSFDSSEKNNLKGVESKTSNANTKKKSTIKKKTGKTLLSRPIICICNDQFAHVLTDLRKVAFLVTVPPTSVQKLSERLAAICRQEHLVTNARTLAALCEMTDCDIRSCLNTLQFVGRRTSHLTLAGLRSIPIGHKDSVKGLFQIWQSVFSLPKSNRNSSTRIHNSINDDNENYHIGEGTCESNYSANILGMVSSNGEYRSIMDGLYENFLSIHFSDPSMYRVCEAYEWLHFNDSLSESIASFQSHSLMRYLPYIPNAFHHLCAIQDRKNIMYPRETNYYLTQQRNMKSIASSLLGGSTPSLRAQLTTSLLCSDIVSYLLSIIAVKFRPVGAALMTPFEKKLLSNIISILTSYNLTFIQERIDDGGYTFKMSPDLSKLVRFPDESLDGERPSQKGISKKYETRGTPRSKNNHVDISHQLFLNDINSMHNGNSRLLSYPTKQMLALGVANERCRRAEARLVEDSENAEPIVTIEVDTLDSSSSNLPPSTQSAVTSAKRKRKAGQHQARNFFNELVAQKRTKFESKSIPGDSVNTPRNIAQPEIIFKFNEGHSNAVRLSIRMKDLL